MLEAVFISYIENLWKQAKKKVCENCHLYYKLFL